MSQIPERSRSKASTALTVLYNLFHPGSSTSPSTIRLHCLLSFTHSLASGMLSCLSLKQPFTPSIFYLRLVIDKKNKLLYGPFCQNVAIVLLIRYSQDDPELLRECDIRLKLRMSSIMYVHSQRFTIEMLQFFQKFILLRDAISNWRATNAGMKVSVML